MAATPRPKASDKQAVIKKLFPLLKKSYKSTAPKIDLPILETLIYGICLENASSEEADAAQERIDELFHDYNEMRVSSITELNRAFEGMSAPELRSLRVRSVLHHVFETNYEFEFEAIRRKTMELATKQLNKIRNLSPFIKNFTLQTALGCHVIPVDDAMAVPLKWLGLVEWDSSPEDASEGLKSAVRKSDGLLFCHLIRTLAHDPKLSDTLGEEAEFTEDEDYELSSAPTRLKQLIESGGRKRSSKSSTKKTAKSRSKSKSSQSKNGSSKTKKKSKRKSTSSR